MTNKNQMKEIKTKVKDIDKLPTYEEVMNLFYFLKTKKPESWKDFCKKQGIYLVPNKEFVDELSKEIRKLKESPIVEICAGNGKLSYHLRKRGVDIIATDIGDVKINDVKVNDNIKINEDLVEKLSYQDALEKYNPKIVVGAWLPADEKIGLDVLNYKSVNFFFDISSGVPEWIHKAVNERDDLEYRTYLDTIIQNYCISFSDHMNESFHIGNTSVYLIKRKEFKRADIHASHKSPRLGRKAIIEKLKYPLNLI